MWMRVLSGRDTARSLPAVFFWLLTFLAVLPAASQVAPPAPAAPAPAPNQEFLRAADEVLLEVSALVKLPVRAPLKKSLRSREEIRAYILRELREDEEPQKRYADQKALEKFGLLPKGFDLEAFLVELLTEQVAGLYDPREQEFYIADWLPAAEQRVVMAHELVHALHDQHFRLKPWMDAAKPNDDAQFARDAVAEGAATVAMLEFLVREVGLPNQSARTMGDLRPLIRSQLDVGLASSPQLAKAPAFVRDALMFPYLEGAIFTQKILRTLSGWEEFAKVFENPPVSTQQILHPELYLSGATPEPVLLKGVEKRLPRGWKKLDENHLGEFGLHAVIKHFLGQERADELAPAWAGDRYAVFERERDKAVLLVFRLQLADEAAAVRFFGAYSDALEGKYATRTELFRRPNFFSFGSEEGGVFLHCVVSDCLSVEGVDRATFDAINRGLKRPAAPGQAKASKMKVAVKTFEGVKVGRLEGSTAALPAPVNAPT